MPQIKLFDGTIVQIEDPNKVTYPRFLAIAGVEDRPRSEELYEWYLASQFDDVAMLLADFRGGGLSTWITRPLSARSAL